MSTEHTTYQPYSIVRSAAVALVLVAAAIAASTSAAAPRAPSFVVRTTCTDSRSFVSITPPRLVRATTGKARRTWTYGWPVKPFNRQHPVRGFLNDPRNTFHFGIDIAVPDRTPVYAVAAGTVNLRRDEKQAVEVLTYGASLFAYWHIDPVVRQGQHVGLHQLIGRVGRDWGHVHFGERDGVVYVNPLRSGGLGPYVDRTPPSVDEIGLDGTALVAAAHDTPDPRVPGSWADEPVTPGLLRWRTVLASGRATRWQTAFDFRGAQLGPTLYRQVYTTRTEGNHKGDPGQYCFFLQHAARPADGTIVEVEVSDTAGNTSVYAAILEGLRGSL